MWDDDVMHKKGKKYPLLNSEKTRQDRWKAQNNNREIGIASGTFSHGPV